MILISKESKGSYNAVIANINQKVSSIIGMIEKLVSSSETNSSELESSLNSLTHQASNLKTYVEGLLNINKQLDAHMPDSCNYKWAYTETKYNCAEPSDCGDCSDCSDCSDCGDCGDCDNDCGNCYESCTYDCGESCTYDCGESCSYDCGESCTYDCGESCSYE
jgi:hypothetical protein